MRCYSFREFVNHSDKLSVIKVYISLVGFSHIMNLPNVLIYIARKFYDLDFSS